MGSTLGLESGSGGVMRGAVIVEDEFIRPDPVAYLLSGCNPWDGMLSDDRLIEILLEAADAGEEQIRRWIRSGEAPPDATAAQVIFDPTLRRRVFAADQALIAVILYGDAAVARGHLEGAVGAADIVNRCRRPSAEVIECYSHLLGTYDVACTGGVLYKDGVGGGNGLSDLQNPALALLMLRHVFGAVHSYQRGQYDRRMGVTAEKVEWWNKENKPRDDRYEVDLGASHWVVRSRF